MSDDWGPWIEHDGMGCRVVGHVVHFKLGFSAPDGGDPMMDGGAWCSSVIEVINGAEGICIAKDNPSWNWQFDYYPIISYRVRKPKGANICDALRSDVPALVDA